MANNQTQKGEDGIRYMKSKDGVLRVFIIIVGCATFALIAHSGFGGVITWVMAAYIVSFVISLQSYFLLATNVASHMSCGVSFYTADVCLSIFSFFSCLLASVVLAVYTNGSSPNERIAAVALGFLVAILYGIEVYLLQADAPESFYYMRTARGIIKTLICIFGCVTFALLGASGFRCYYYTDGCDPARTWAFAAFIYCWIGSVIFLLINVSGLAERFTVLVKVDLGWSLFSFLNYLAASIVVACYIKCIYFNNYECGTRVASVVFGFLTAVLYVIEAVLLVRPSGIGTSEHYDSDISRPTSGVRTIWGRGSGNSVGVGP